MTDITKIATEDLIKFSYKDLLTHQAKVNKAVELRYASEKEEVYKSLLSLASEKGFSFDEFTGNKSAKVQNKKSDSKIQYRNPTNLDEGWTGKGRKPNWLVALLESGKNLEEFKI